MKQPLAPFRIEVVASSGGPGLHLSGDPDPARSLAEQLSAAGLALNTRCGHRGMCAGCTVHLLRGEVSDDRGRTVSAPAGISACQCRPAGGGPVVIDVPPRSRLAHRPQIATTFKVLIPAARQPIIAPRAGADLGLAVDVGTTTVVLLLVDLATGKILAQASDFNRQIELGDDVLTRIERCSRPDQRLRLHETLTLRTLSPLIAEVCRQAGRSPSAIAAATVAGNTTMLHLLAGEDPTSLGVAPFMPVFLGSRQLTTAELGLSTVPSDGPAGACLPDGMPWHLLPGLSAYVGADLNAGLFCTGLAYETGPSLLIDIGTNGEILLRHRGRLLACATAAGPAFEGGRLAAGTRAVAGAISRVRLAPRRAGFNLDRIQGSVTTLGLCGSAYVDFMAEARGAGWLTASGRFAGDFGDPAPAEGREGARAGRSVQLAPGEPASTICEADIAELLQAKAAIAAGTLTLLRHAGLVPSDVQRLYLAGGFGLHLDLAHAIACGLLPGFRSEQIEVVGNTALGGAWLALTDCTVLPEMSAAAAQVEIVELNLQPDFEDTFIDQLALP